MRAEMAISAQRQLNAHRDSSFCAKSLRYNIFMNGASLRSPGEITLLLCVHQRWAESHFSDSDSVPAPSFKTLAPTPNNF